MLLTPYYLPVLLVLTLADTPVQITDEEYAMCNYMAHVAQGVQAKRQAGSSLVDIQEGLPTLEQAVADKVFKVATIAQTPHSVGFSLFNSCVQTLSHLNESKLQL